MANIPTREPASVVAGDTIAWQIALPDYPASDGWVLNYRLINAAGKIDIVGSASGADHRISVSAVTSAAWVAGQYGWVSFVTKGAERYTVAHGSITVEPNLAAQAGGYDTRSVAAAALEAFEAVLLGRASQAHLEYTYGDRAVKLYPLGEILVIRDKLKQEVAREQAAARVAAGLPSQNNVRVRL